METLVTYFQELFWGENSLRIAILDELFCYINYQMNQYYL